MASIRSRGYVRDGLIVWDLEGDQLEYTPAEFQELIRSLAGDRLFATLELSRPALLLRIRARFAERCRDPEDEKELEHRLEECLFALERKVRPG